MRKMIIEVKPHLPPLAWIAVIDRDKVVFVCGEKVEHRDNYAVSGVWSGDYEQVNFDTVAMFCGSGLKLLDNNSVEISTATHALEKVFVYKTEENVYVSNSFCLLLAYCDLKLDIMENQYESIMCSTIDGLDNYKKTIPLSDKHFISQYMICNIFVDDNLQIATKEKAELRDFLDYNDYYSRLTKDIEAMHNNAISAKRHSRYGLVSTISSGYDSCACAAIAKKIGCETVVSLSGGGYDSDSGYSVATALGYKNYIARNNKSYINKSDCIDTEYICSGEYGTHLQFSVFEDLFASNLVFMGLKGDYYWGKNTPVSNRFKIDHYPYFTANISYIENALKNAYIVIPLPTYGASKMDSIRRITLSDEMQPYTLNNDYDRPIPRRIVEECGVSRNLFGMGKRGGGFCMNYDTKKSIKNKMTIAGYDDFIHTKIVRSMRSKLKNNLTAIKFLCLNFPTYFNFLSGKMNLKITLKQKLIKMSNPKTPNDLFFWSVSKMTSKYRKELFERS